MRHVVMIGLALAAAAPAGAQRTNDAAAMMRSLGGGGLQGKKLAKAIEKAAASPLGSQENPVRADMPEGERAYLRRLRCADGTAPAFNRIGSFGVGVFGNILDGYTVTCTGNAPATVYMDMYHAHREEAAVPGFSMERPAA